MIVGRALQMIFCLLALLGCVTTDPAPPPRIPAVLEPLFMGCAPADGASAARAFDGENLLGSAEVEWLAKTGGDWDLEATNPVGSSVLKLRRRGAIIAASGGLADRLPRFSVRRDGFLIVDGQMVGIKAAEIPCLLGFRLPRRWIASLRDVTTDRDFVSLQFEEERRQIRVVATGLVGAKPTGQICANLSWRRFLFFTTEIVWCQSTTGRKEATLTGVADYALKWVRIDESL